MPPPHAGLIVYQKALDAVEQLELVVQRFPQHRRDLVDQVRRASASVVLNIAEGASEFSHAEKARFYRMARRSGSECLAAIDIAERTLGPQRDADRARSLLDEVGMMLTRMIRDQSRP